MPVESTVDDRMIKGQVSVARNGNIYFTGRVLSERVPGIFICRYSNSKYLAPEKLAGPLATLPLVLDPWVDPDEKFLLVSCPPQEGPPLRTDIGISFRQPDGSWGIPVRLGGAVNTEAFERFASLSQDGKYLFFIRSLSPQFVGDQAHFYWVDARILEGPQPKNNKELSGGASGENFTPKGRLVTEGRIFSVASHDFDNDGRPDVVVSDFLNPARILYNDAGLEFKKVVPLTSTAETATGGHGVALADFNGDGCLDLFLVYNGNPARLLFGDGRGGFMDSGRAIGKPGLFGTSVEVADVDRDGDLDVFVIYYQERARLYLNDGAGSFAVSDQTFYDGVAVGDLDGDGDADVVSLREKGQASVWLNEKGRFILQEQTVDVGEGIGHLDLIDTDADGDLDIFALGRTTKSALWENDGRGSFRKSAQEFNSGTRVAAGDIDLDGKEDLVVGFSVWLNKGSGRFEHVQTIGPGTPSALELVDIDGDGDLDLLGAGLDRATGKSDLLLFLNTVRRR